MGRPKGQKPPAGKFSIRLTDELRGKLEILAKNDKRVLGNYIQKVLEDHVDQHAIDEVKKKFNSPHPNGGSAPPVPPRADAG